LILLPDKKCLVPANGRSVVYLMRHLFGPLTEDEIGSPALHKVGGEFERVGGLARL
jgi:hypothetical protein